MNDFRAGKPLAPDHIVTAQAHADYLLREVANLSARNAYLQTQANANHDLAVAALVDLREALKALRPWQIATALALVGAILRFIAQ